MTIQSTELDHGTWLFTCSSICAECLTEAEPEVHDWQTVHLDSQPILACCHCSWCGIILQLVPDHCFFHGNDCPSIQPDRMVAVALAARRYRDVLGAAPAARHVNLWITQASNGLTDTRTLLGF